MSTTVKKETSLPVLSYHTGSGWETLGFAASVEGAISVVKRNVGDATRSLVKNFGFEVHAWRRTELQRELNGGPDGYVFSVGKAVRNV